MEKEKYYVNLQNKEISRTEPTTKHELTIYATPNEVQSLRNLFNNIHSADVSGFFRAHVPIMPYSNDQPNDQYDASYVDAARVLYDLGDEDAKHFIEESGIIQDKPRDS